MTDQAEAGMVFWKLDVNDAMAPQAQLLYSSKPGEGVSTFVEVSVELGSGLLPVGSHSCVGPLLLLHQAKREDMWRLLKLAVVLSTAFIGSSLQLRIERGHAGDTVFKSLPCPRQLAIQYVPVCKRQGRLERELCMSSGANHKRLTHALPTWPNTHTVVLVIVLQSAEHH